MGKILIILLVQKQFRFRLMFCKIIIFSLSLRNNCLNFAMGRLEVRLNQFLLLLLPEMKILDDPILISIKVSWFRWSILIEFRFIRN